MDNVLLYLAIGAVITGVIYWFRAEAWTAALVSIAIGAITFVLATRLGGKEADWSLNAAGLWAIGSTIAAGALRHFFPEK